MMNPLVVKLPKKKVLKKVVPKGVNNTNAMNFITATSIPTK